MKNVFSLNPVIAAKKKAPKKQIADSGVDPMSLPLVKKLMKLGGKKFKIINDEVQKVPGLIYFTIYGAPVQYGKLYMEGFINEKTGKFQSDLEVSIDSKSYGSVNITSVKDISEKVKESEFELAKAKHNYDVVKFLTKQLS